MAPATGPELAAMFSRQRLTRMFYHANILVARGGRYRWLWKAMANSLEHALLITWKEQSR